MNESIEKHTGIKGEETILKRLITKLEYVKIKAAEHEIKLLEKRQSFFLIKQLQEANENLEVKIKVQHKKNMFNTTFLNIKAPIASISKPSQETMQILP